MKKLLKRLAILAAPIVWRKIQQRRRGGHHGSWSHKGWGHKGRSRKRGWL